MAKKTSASKKSSTKAKAAAAKNRRLKTSHYKTFRLSKRIKHPGGKLPAAWRLFARSLRHLLGNWKLYLGLVLVYLILTVVLVKGFGVSNNLPQLKNTLETIITGKNAELTTSFTLFGVLLGSSGSTSSDVAAAYQSMLLLIMSLVFIWSLRQTHADHKVGIREAFYKGLYPFVPFLLVLLVIGLQLVPLLLANGLYGLIFSNGLAVTVLEKLLWASLLFLLALLSLYMVSSSIFALYIVTLPDMTPLKALRSARELVRFRRWTVLRKVIFLPLALLVLAAVLILPLIVWATFVAEWVFLILNMLALLVVHSYLYSLYRELIQ